MSLAGSSKEANAIATTNINGDDGDWGLSMDFNKVVYPALTPGAPLEAMNMITIASIAQSLDQLQAGGGTSTTIGLNRWIRHELTLAITDSVYGPRNPFKNRAIEDAFWDFESDLFRIMMNLLPSLTARKGYLGRQLMSDAFVEYFQNEGLKDASVFAQTRFASAANHKLALRDIARFEVVNLIGTLTSTIRTVIWLLYHIYADPAVLSDCRREVPNIMTAIPDAQGALSRRLDITRLKSNCPILGSTFQEVLRRHAVGTSVRQVMRDTLLENTYLLKKNAIIIMPSIVVHNDASIWGPDVSAFNHKRFLKPAPSAQSSVHKGHSSSAFRAFGGGTTLCPGRHFATTVTMAMAVMFLMRYEMTPVEGRWPHMTADKTHAVATVEMPDHEIEVEVKVRQGFEEGKWAFRLDNSEVVFATAAEDFLGLGFATCCRLADEFLTTRSAIQSLKLIVSTRSTKKSEDTIARLRQHVDSNPRCKAVSGYRISFHAVQLDLTSLRSVQAAAQELLSSVPKIDTIICNAGIAGPITINWPQAIWAAIVDPIYSVTFPYFARGSLGLLTKPQLAISSDRNANGSLDKLTAPQTSSDTHEPPLGEIFSANIFGHYLLAHALTPVLSHASHPPARIICLSSLETPDYAFSLTDLQGLSTIESYHSSKRLTDILALTASLPTSKPYTDKFFTPPGSARPLAPHPRFYVCHPGVCGTDIFPLIFVMRWLKILTFYIARWLGSPWHNISTRKGACAPVWLALAAQETLDGLEAQDGLGKWGSTTDAGGSERVRRTEVDGWGYGGQVGKGREFGNRGRRRGAKDLTVEDREAFEQLGREAWREMEALRVEWEERLS
ncbi:hypothetical protein MMC18_004387 [Xylographa bjoerkii]|nr:hypothetical protein [Xylographa bjoerkii]